MNRKNNKNNDKLTQSRIKDRMHDLAEKMKIAMAAEDNGYLEVLFEEYQKLYRQEQDMKQNELRSKK